MFNELSSIPNLVDQEKKTADFWRSTDIVKRLKDLRKDSPEKVYYDGPITANGVPHYAHAITWTLKDIIPRFWSMQGYFVRRNMGWDCQGIPVEYEVEKEMKFEKKEDIEAFGVAKFNDLCRQSVLKYRQMMFDYEEKLGRWFDQSETYATMEPAYIESMWWSLKELFTKGYLYEGHKVVAYSTRAGTSLSTHEVDDGGYKEIEDPFVTVKFKLRDVDNTYVLAWTTTPWTIPGNLMLAVGEKIDYVEVDYDSAHYILAAERLDDVFKDKDYKVVKELNASDLVGKEYDPPFDFYESKRAEGCFKIVTAGHTNTQDGTGIVHLAPYGAEDFEVFMSMGVTLFDYLDETANFTNAIPQYAGMYYKKANPVITKDLEKLGRLFATGTLVHRMPMCWRTGTPLIYKPIKSWYIAVTKLKARMLEENQKINWQPEKIKDSNSGIWISNARDWALSRSRYWGTPLPVWVNDKTGEKVFIGSFAELKEKSGVQLTDPHKPFVDDITWEDTVNGGTFGRVKDVIDVWYDSGSMPFAQYHYPFEHQERFKTSMPAEYISEGPDQVRLWFYVMHVLGVALFDQVPYKNVVTIGMMLDEHGKKMSKSKRNYKPMDEVLNDYGGDILRYFVLTSPIVNGQDAIFSEDNLKDARKGFFLPLWNSLKYFVTFANVHKFEPTLDKPTSEDMLDRWIMLRLQETINGVTEYLETYKIMEACKMLEPFVTDLSTWYIRRSRDRIKDGDKQALATLYYVLSQFTKLMAPVVPFLAETMYKELQVATLTGLDSVHLDSFPKSEALSTEDAALLTTMANTREIVSLALAIRVRKSLKVRQPLSTLVVQPSVDARDATMYTDYFAELIKEELNVKEVITTVPEILAGWESETDKNLLVYLDTKITEELQLEGDAREFVRKIQDLRKDANLSVSDEIEVVYPNDEKTLKIVEKFGDEIKHKVAARAFTAGSDFRIKKLS